MKKGVVSSAELATVLDLTKLPIPKDAKFNTRTAAEFSVIVPGIVPAITDFYLKGFADAGFQVTGAPGSKMITDDYSQAALARDGYSVSLSVTKGSEPGTLMVSANRHGALDARELPVSPGGKSLYGSSTSSMYVGQGSVKEEVDFIVKDLNSKGWRRYDRPNSSSAESEDSQQFDMRNQGYLVSLYASKAPAQDNKTVVQYQVRTIAHELPAPLDATNLKFDDARVELTCDAPGDVSQLFKFYSEAMPKVGCKPLKHDDPKPKSAILRFEPAEKGILLIELSTEDNKTTKVASRYFSAEFLAEMKRQSDEANKPKPEPTKPTAEKIVAQDIALPAEALEVTYTSDAEEIKFHAKGALEPFAKSLIEKLKSAGWKYDDKFSIVSENLASLEFKKGEASLSAKLINIGLGDGTEVTISTKGLTWQSK